MEPGVDAGKDDLSILKKKKYDKYAIRTVRRNKTWVSTGGGKRSAEENEPVMAGRTTCSSHSGTSPPAAF